jgi:hypothetical protein
MQNKDFLNNRLKELKTELHELKVSVASKKLSANGLFGKLGSPYSPVHSPDLMLAVTITGQLHLACIIHNLNKIKGINVQSANTDGICIVYPPDLRDEMLNVFKKHSDTTGFEYEETRYSVTAFANVNNYIAITTKGKAKRKGLYAATSLSKNPTMEVCSNLAVDYLRDGTHPRDGIAKYTNMKDYVAIRAVRGGGIQFDHLVEVDDWVLVDDVGTKDNVWMRQKHLDQRLSIDDQGGAPHVKRKSRPHPVEVGVGGEPFGRVARWFMTTDKIPPISYISSGNKVPKTEGARVCMTLPTELPKDIDFDWYVKESLSMLKLMGVDVNEQ